MNSTSIDHKTNKIPGFTILTPSCPFHNQRTKNDILSFLALTEKGYVYKDRVFVPDNPATLKIMKMIFGRKMLSTPAMENALYRKISNQDLMEGIKFKKGLNDPEIEDLMFRFRSEAYMDLTIEIQRDHTGITDHGAIVIVEHHFKQNGDLMSDPRIDFLVPHPGIWIPLNFTQHSLGIYQEFLSEKGIKERAIRDCVGFTRTWAKNLSEQRHRLETRS